ncbi:hypothetical protein ABFX02_09G067200 [Erythranthe guttata]
MSRRRLRIVCSSDEEATPPPPPPPPPPLQQLEEEIDDDILDDIEIDFQTVNINSSNPTPNSNISTATTNTSRTGSRVDEPIPLDISDEDEENITTGDATNGPNFHNSSGDNGYFEASESPVNGVLESLGLRLKREWLDSCLRGLQSSVSGFQGMDASAKARLCFEQFLCSDMNYCGAGVLPPNVQALNLVDLKGPFVLQVDEIVNISCPLRGRYQNLPPGDKRCLKLSMTDGVQRVYGMEYRPINGLQVLAAAGFKVVVCNVNIRHGMLMLVPEALEVLGGSVEEMEAARQRLVIEINKPPRGKRNRTGVIPPLATRATRAAWPSQTDAEPAHADRNTTAPQHATGRGAAVSIPANDTHGQVHATPLNRNNAEPNSSAAARPQEHEVPRRTNIPASTPLSVARGTAFSTPANDMRREEFRVPVSRRNAEPSTFSTLHPPDRVTIPQNLDEDMAEVTTPSTATGQATPSNMTANHMPEEDVRIPVSRENTEPTTSFTGHIDFEEVQTGNEMDHHFMLPTDREAPFTYLASLSAKCAGIDDEASVVRGKIKCFLTGVKGFQYKQKPTYELRVYIDDGSLISEILIDHKVVQNAIGYSPQEVIAALASSEPKRVTEMKETMKQFQIFLVNFEGTMVVEMHKASPVPVAVEMEQGCFTSDAWSLLNRLKSSAFAQPTNVSRYSNHINLSP